MPDAPLSFDVVVVGAGPAGLAAACVAAESGQRVGLVDETPWLGGQIWRGQDHNPNQSPNGSSTAAAQGWLTRFRNSRATLLDQTTVIAAPETGLLLAEKEGAPLQLRWKKLVLATGARELFLPFPGWTLPGVIGPGGLQALVKNGWPLQAQRVLLAGSGPLLLAVADGLRRHRAQVVAIVEQASRTKVNGFGLSLWRHPSKLWQGIKLKLAIGGVPYHCGAWPVRAEGADHVQRVTLTNGHKTWQVGCDYLACGFGLVPNVELPLLLGCDLADGFVRVDSHQATSVPNVYCAGEPTGIGGADCALVEGQIAGYALSDQMAQAEGLFAARRSWHQFRRALAETFALRPEVKALADDATIVCRCEDVTLGQLRAFKSWREAKLQTRCGMGACQGRICGAATREILGWGMTSVRPPVLPARVQSLISEMPSNELSPTPAPTTAEPARRKELGNASQSSAELHSAVSQICNLRTSAN
jgi:NADPH-dependent 2,4-dienoyl-CoA reductase/sulfur reductase-like enzyme